MADLATLRARLKDRQAKAGALGTTETTICLDLTLIEELDELKAERERLLADAAINSGSLAGSAPADTSEIDAQIGAKQAEVKDASLTLVFRAVSSSVYDQIMNQFEDPDESRTEFMNALAGRCLYQVWAAGENVGGSSVEGGLTWDEIREQTTFGEWDSTVTKVFALNRRKIDSPFSSRPSKTTQR